MSIFKIRINFSIQLVENMYQFFDDLRDDFAEFGETFQQAEDLVNPAADDVDADGLDDNADP